MSCPRCGEEMVWDEEIQGYYCSDCRLREYEGEPV